VQGLQSFLPAKSKELGSALTLTFVIQWYGPILNLAVLQRFGHSLTPCTARQVSQPTLCVAAWQVGIYKALLDTASGLDYLHSIGVVHGDLKTANVLLKGSAKDPRGFKCLIADFGLSRVLDLDATHISTATYGEVQIRFNSSRFEGPPRHSCNRVVALSISDNCPLLTYYTQCVIHWCHCISSGCRFEATISSDAGAQQA